MSLKVLFNLIEIYDGSAAKLTEFKVLVYQSRDSINEVGEVSWPY
jgi:hypothetical protein